MMATQSTITGGVIALPRVTLPMPAVARILARYDRAQLAAFIEIAIDLADTIDAPDDPDLPDFRARSDGLPGSPDDCEPDVGDHEAGSYAEWHTLGAIRRRSGGCVVDSCGNEDDEADDFGEEDDPAGQCDEDGVNTARPLASGPGCEIADAGEPDARDLRKAKAGDDLREI